MLRTHKQFITNKQILQFFSAGIFSNYFFFLVVWLYERALNERTHAVWLMHIVIMILLTVNFLSLAVTLRVVTHPVIIHFACLLFSHSTGVLCRRRVSHIHSYTALHRERERERESSNNNIIAPLAIFGTESKRWYRSVFEPRTMCKLLYRLCWSNGFSHIFFSGLESRRLRVHQPCCRCVHAAAAAQCVVRTQCICMPRCWAQWMMVCFSFYASMIINLWVNIVQVFLLRSPLHAIIAGTSVLCERNWGSESKMCFDFILLDYRIWVYGAEHNERWVIFCAR